MEGKHSLAIFERWLLLLKGPIFHFHDYGRKGTVDGQRVVRCFYVESQSKCGHLHHFQHHRDNLGPHKQRFCRKFQVLRKSKRLSRKHWLCTTGGTSFHGFSRKKRSQSWVHWTPRTNGTETGGCFFRSSYSELPQSNYKLLWGKWYPSLHNHRNGKLGPSDISFLSNLGWFSTSIVMKGYFLVWKVFSFLQIFPLLNAWFEITVAVDTVD